MKASLYNFRQALPVRSSTATEFQCHDPGRVHAGGGGPWGTGSSSEPRHRDAETPGQEKSPGRRCFGREPGESSWWLLKHSNLG